MKITFLTAFFTISAILLSSCSEEKQSRLDIDSISGRATIEGKVLYNSGTTSDGQGGIKFNQYSPVANKTVYFNLDLSSLGYYDGKIVYSTETNHDGSFSIDLRANPKGIRYTIHVESFKTSKTEYDPYTSSFTHKNYYFSNANVDRLIAFENIGEYKEIKLETGSEIE